MPYNIWGQYESDDDEYDDECDCYDCRRYRGEYEDEVDHEYPTEAYIATCQCGKPRENLDILNEQYVCSCEIAEKATGTPEPTWIVYDTVEVDKTWVEKTYNRGGRW